MKKEEYRIPVNLFPFGFADELATGMHINEEVVSRCVEAISTSFEPTEDFNRNITSYALKNILEARLGEEISNGAFIAAMLAAGYKYERVKCTPNCYFNVSQKGIERIREINKGNKMTT